jgi:hypothetical protein
MQTFISHKAANTKWNSLVNGLTRNVNLNMTMLALSFESKKNLLSSEAILCC